ncbi:hypothetical protein Taro_055671 [Colocasia esculenta]|uniref:Retrotransposon gag domain-containing protein n=1 Tax=Colocasia esculenta TaxID=4460 RepID=A0A843XTL8_COLES|nr:hypothetical protein [Colocasia esculenta]
MQKGTLVRGEDVDTSCMEGSQRRDGYTSQSNNLTRSPQQDGQEIQQQRQFNSNGQSVGIPTAMRSKDSVEADSSQDIATIISCKTAVLDSGGSKAIEGSNMAHNSSPQKDLGKEDLTQAHHIPSMQGIDKRRSAAKVVLDKGGNASQGNQGVAIPGVNHMDANTKSSVQRCGRQYHWLACDAKPEILGTSYPNHWGVIPNDEDKVTLATYMLQETADVWWASLLRTQFEDGAIDVAWDEFVRLFRAKFVPEHVQDRME